MKSSSLEICRHHAGLVPVPVLVQPKASSGRIRPSQTVLRAVAPLALAFLALFTVETGHAQQAAKAATRITLTASTDESSSRTHATFTAQVGSDERTGAVPTGSVSFMSGERAIGAAFLDTEGRATYTADALPAGEQKITAVYEGDNSFESANSTPAPISSATSGVPGFTLTATSTSLTVAPGQTVSTVITATPENGFNQAISLSCSGVPYTSTTCVFSPAQVTPGAVTAAAPNGTPVISTLSIQTTAYSGGELRNPFSAGHEIAYGVALPGILALAGLGIVSKRKRFSQALGRNASNALRMTALLCLLLAGGMGLSSCSQKYKYYHKAPTGNPGTPVGTYTVVISGITGTGSTLTTSTLQVTLTVANTPS